MALSKLEPDEERVQKLAERLKEIIETTWLKDPKLNDGPIKEFKAIKKEIEDMGLYVSWTTRINLDDPSNPKLEADITVWIPQNTTIH